MPYGFCFQELIGQRMSVDSEIREVDKTIEQLLSKKLTLMASRDAIIANAENGVEGMSTHSGLRSLLEVAGPSGLDINRILTALTGRSETGGGSRGTIYGY